MKTQWTTKGNRDAGSSCSCDRGLPRYIWNFGLGGGGLNHQSSPSTEHHWITATQYDDRLRKMQMVPRFSYGRGLLRKNGATNRMFLTFLFDHQEMSIQFLKDVGLIPSKVQCNIYQRDTTCTADPYHSDGYRWRCRKSVARFRYRGTVSIRHGNTTFPQISAYRRE